MLFGPENNLGLKLVGASFEVIDLEKGNSVDDVLVHDNQDKNLANLISEMTYNEKLPVPFGVFYKQDKPTYEDMMVNQIKEAVESKGEGNVQSLIDGIETWTVK